MRPFLVSILAIFCGFSRAETDEMELIFVHSIWRHGDRSQDGHLKNDPLDPSEWNKGGGGYGQLTPEGMEQQYVLGKKLRNRYIENLPFLHNFYDSQQIYIRSTDVNRTINSAFANMMGMFSGGGRPGTDYPEMAGWPRGFMPVPIHSTGPSKTDCVANAFCSCKRRNELIDIAHTGEQYQTYIKSENYIKTMALISELFNTTFTADNMWQVHDAVYIQLIHFPEKVRNQSWYTNEFYENLDELERPTKLFVSGIYDPPVVNGINVRREILKTRGGSLINEIAARMRTKAACAKSSAKCDQWHWNLKYYAYSTHDHTVFALLAVLGIEDIVAGPEKYGAWPDYASDILIELFQNQTDSRPYFRILYQPDVHSNFSVVTQKIKGCKGLEFCDLKVFENRAKEFRPDRPMENWCQVSPVPENKAKTWMKELMHYEDDSNSASSNSYRYLVTLVTALGFLF